jgi:outer membrane protein assembly factor BamB
VKSITSLCTGLVAAIGLASSPSFAGDQPQWGEKFSRNMVSSETGLADSFDPASGKNIKWHVPLGTQSYATPIVAGGKVFIGTNNDLPRDPKHKLDSGVLLCLNATDGSLAWQLISPKIEADKYMDWPHTGWQSPPSIEGDKVYVVSNRGEVMCLDLKGLANGNDGPYKDEGKHMSPRGIGEEVVNPTDGDILWLFDMVKGAGIWPHDAAHSSILIDGPFLYLNTGNGVDNTHKKIRRPDAPSLIVIEKATGKLIAMDDEKIGDKIFHATWSSPCLAEVNGKRQIIFGGGDGIVYSFEALDHSFTLPNGSAPAKLKKIWSFNCDPDGPKGDIHPYSGNRRISPSNIMTMPVFYEGRIYVTAGGDFWWGKRKSWLKCIDPTKEGDITKTGQVWSYSMETHCMSTPVIKDGLAYISDAARNVHCIDIKTGEAVWNQKTNGEMWASPMVADGKIYIGTCKGDFWILAAGREKKVLCQTSLGAQVSGTATAANGVVYIATMKDIWAIGK